MARAWDVYQAERYRRGETSQWAAYIDNPVGHADDHPVPQHTPGQFKKLDAVVVLTARLLTTPLNVSLSGGYPGGRSRRRGQEPRRASAGQRYIRWFFRRYYGDPH